MEGGKEAARPSDLASYRRFAAPVFDNQSRYHGRSGNDSIRMHAPPLSVLKDAVHSPRTATNHGNMGYPGEQTGRSKEGPAPAGPLAKMLSRSRSRVGSILQCLVISSATLASPLPPQSLSLALPLSAMTSSAHVHLHLPPFRSDRLSRHLLYPAGN